MGSVEVLSATRAGHGDSPPSPRTLRILYGRGMNSMSDAYKLPADDPERNRLTLLHRVWRGMLGGDGLYPALVDGIVQGLLSPTNASGAQPAVLDVGSGSGDWALEMALAFPGARVLGIDLEESTPRHRYVPPNCSFAAKDAILGLEDIANQFDVVHCRCVRGHVSDETALVKALVTALKPGALVLFSDGNLRIFDEAHEQLAPPPLTTSESAAHESSTCPESGGDHTTEPTPEKPDDTSTDFDTRSYSWLARWFAEVTDVTGGMARAQADRTFGPHARDTSEDIDGNGEFLAAVLRRDGRLNIGSVEERVFWSPIGWSGVAGEDDEQRRRGEELGRASAENMLEYIYSSTPMLLSGGRRSEDVALWAEKCTEEIADPERRFYMKWGVAWATKASESSQ